MSRVDHHLSPIKEVDASQELMCLPRERVGESTFPYDSFNAQKLKEELKKIGLQIITPYIS
jgi:hypothetical protein